MIVAYSRGDGVATNYEIAWVTVALQHLRVGDDSSDRMDPGAPMVIDPMVRRAQLGHVATPTSLLAFVAWQSGNGALADLALDRALADDPCYSMALLLREAIVSGAPPSLARLPMTPEEVAASYAGLEAGDAGHDDDRADDAAGEP